MTILGKKRLTARRRQCLAALEAATGAAGGPVHYSAVAAVLGGSPWTAYDLLRALESVGLVTVVHIHRVGVSVGRPQVAFTPSDAGRSLLGDSHEADGEARALRRARERAGGAAALGADLASHLGFWLRQAEQLPGRTRSGLIQLLSAAPEAASALTTFVGAVYGAVGPQGGDGQNDDLLAAVTAFQLRLARTTAARRERLARSLAVLLDPRVPLAGTTLDGASA